MCTFVEAIRGYIPTLTPLDLRYFDDGISGIVPASMLGEVALVILQAWQYSEALTVGNLGKYARSRLRHPAF